MDKNKILGIAFLILAFTLYTTTTKKMLEPQDQSGSGKTATSATGGTSPTGNVAPNTTSGTSPIASANPQATEIANAPALEEALYELTVEDEFTITFTSQGGAIKQILYTNDDRRFRKFDPDRLQKILGNLNSAVELGNEKLIDKWQRRAEGEHFPKAWIEKAKEPVKDGKFDAIKLFGDENNYIINEGQSAQILGMEFRGIDTRYLHFEKSEQIDKENEKSITFQAKTDKLLITRKYTLVPDSFRLQHETTIYNFGTEPYDPGSQIFYSMGASLPTTSDQRYEFQNVGFYEGKRGMTSRRIPKNFKLPKMQKNGGTMEESAGGIFWAAVRNQYFTVSLSPETPTSGVVRGKVYDLETTNYRGEAEYGVSGQFGLNTDLIPPGQTITQKLNMYAGPKEYARLSKAGKHQDLVMQFGFFGFFSKILLMLMQWLYSFVGNWGWAIITMTILIKLLFWPLTAKASESQKRMQKISAPMKELQEKYKDNPQKMQMEVSKLFRENKVNPAAGCLPIFIQMPIFLGLFFMLRSAGELRFAEFLWITDLSEPERLLHWGVNIPFLGEYFNILPILMGITMFIQMSLTPTPTGGNEMAEMQAKMFKFLPFIFLFMLYGFSSGLVLYWTVQNVLSILQTKLVNNKHDDTPIVIPSSGKSKKNRLKTT
jgi:YidC/Oxa1 family membrane protein insertase